MPSHVDNILPIILASSTDPVIGAVGGGVSSLPQAIIDTRSNKTITGRYEQFFSIHLLLITDIWRYGRVSTILHRIT